MSLSSYAKRKALDFARDTFRQAHPDKDVEAGSPIRALLLKPFSVIFAAVFQDLENLRKLNLGNFDEISRADMDRLAENLLEDRPEGSRSVTNVRVFLDQIQEFSVRSFPYFEKDDGTEYMPVSSMSLTTADVLEENGEPYVDIPVISRNFGQNTQAAAGEITNVTNFPVNVVRVTNPEPTSGGDGAMSNAQFFTYLQDAINDGSINQVGGIRQWIVDNYPEFRETRVVDAGHPDLIRDEIWQDDNGNPTLSHDPEESDIPLASVADIELDFGQKEGRVIETNSDLKDDYEGKRVFVENDIEHFRTILKVISDDEAIISGPMLPYGVSNVQNARVITGQPPHQRNMADVYLFAPTLYVRSTTIDNRFFLTTENDESDATEIEYKVREGFSYLSLPDSGDAVFSEGTDDEKRRDVVDVKKDVDPPKLVLDSKVSLSADTPISLYDQDPISIHEDGDIDDNPVVYVLEVEKLDPITMDSAGNLSRTQPGAFDEPGWVQVSNIADREFSTKEDKEIQLLEKNDVPGFREIEESGVSTQDSTFVGDKDVLYRGGVGFEDTEGRVVTIEYPELKLTNVTRLDIDGGRIGVNYINPEKIEVDTNIFDYFVEKGYREDDLLVRTYDSSGNKLNTLQDDDVKVYGDVIESQIGQIFSSSVVEAEVDAEEMTKNPGNVEAPVMRATQNTLEVKIEDGGLHNVYDGQNFKHNVDISMEDKTGEFRAQPLRVVYATHPDIGNVQDELESGDVRDLCEHTMARSMNPTLIDTNIQYSGSSTADQIRSRFVDLIQSSVRQFQDEKIQLAISNVIAALDEEGLTDSVELDFEIKLTHFLKDGERKVQYVNPDPETKQELAIKSAVSQGDSRVTLTEPDVQPSGRGKLFLGGNNPDTQEVVPYEGVVENDDGSITCILRGGNSADHDHPQWEDATISVRDFEPEFEINSDTIEIPRNNRPYVREVIIEKV